MDHTGQILHDLTDIQHVSLGRRHIHVKPQFNIAQVHSEGKAAVWLSHET